MDSFQDINLLRFCFNIKISKVGHVLCHVPRQIIDEYLLQYVIALYVERFIELIRIRFTSISMIIKVIADLFP